MSSTLKTDTLQLPIFVGSDIPSWITDWNSAMNKIDAFAKDGGGSSETIAALQTAVSNLQTQVNAHTAEWANFNNTILPQITTSIQGLDTRMDSAEAGLSSIHTDLTTLQNTVTDLSSFTNTKITEIENQLSDIPDLSAYPPVNDLNNLINGKSRNCFYFVRDARISWITNANSYVNTNLYVNVYRVANSISGTTSKTLIYIPHVSIANLLPQSISTNIAVIGRLSQPIVSQAESSTTRLNFYTIGNCNLLNSSRVFQTSATVGAFVYAGMGYIAIIGSLSLSNIKYVDVTPFFIENIDISGTFNFNKIV